MAKTKDESSKALRDAKNAANVAGLVKMFPPKAKAEEKGKKKTKK